MRPTGQLHLGHYTGALESWVQQQNLLDENGSKVYETCFLIADYHNLTTSLETAEIYSNTLDMLIDWLAVTKTYITIANFVAILKLGLTRNNNKLGLQLLLSP